MDYKDVRKGNTQAEYNDSASSWFFGEIVIVSIILGLGFQSWWIFGASLITFIIMANVRKLAIFLMIVLTITWGVMAFIIGLNYWGYGAAFSLGIIALLFSLGIHAGAIEWMDDMNHDE